MVTPHPPPNDTMLCVKRELNESIYGTPTVLLTAYSPLFQEGTSDSGGVYVFGAAARADGSVVLCGGTFGSFASDSSSVEAGSSDFLALALDEDGNELWRWQV